MAVLERDELTYPEVGASMGDFPTGYRHAHRMVFLGMGGRAFDRAVHALFAWRMHRRAGITVDRPDVRPESGVDFRLELGWRGFRLQAPCRIVYTINEDDRAGFAYGTLPGHPECGEEAFLVRRDGMGQVYFEVRAFSRPGSLIARIAGPVGRLAQDVMTRRYLGAMRSLSRAG
ncbi:DUF1990 family protein [Salinispora arenicola]|uniref:Uncharacterized protein (UPF0548 family) n=1 Tax=Salinispora arenicola TaxID=168697 RepID=A0A542XTU0_SALAC|nr:DUF1990 domain-containing protein [Salinispora arenicola]TQL39255.1 uncharacterized protein (UPF0548 family) [Salinispora arenicola]